jgi:hypothetical protein
MTEHTPQLENLTGRQKALCDVMWALESPQAVDRFIQTLPTEQQQEAESLRLLIVLECLEPFLDHYKDQALDELSAIQTSSRGPSC